jgi:hypothetical protein
VGNLLGSGRTIGLRRGRRAAQATLAVAAASLCIGVAAWASGSPADGPDLQAMALAPSDFEGGATVAAQGFEPASAPAVAEYDRTFGPGARLAGRRLLSAISSVSDFADADTAALAFDGIRLALSTKARRQSLAKALAAELASGSSASLKATSVAVSKPVALQQGQGAFRFTIRIGTRLGRIEMAFVVLRVDRALGLVAVLGYPRQQLTAAPATLAGAKLAQRFNAGFTVRSVAPPSIVGALQPGQTLSADPGRWAGAPSAFTYQWNRCDAAGANCAAIAGAVGQSYVLGATDSRARLTVTVKAGNSVSSTSMTSGATTPVP